MPDTFHEVSILANDAIAELQSLLRLSVPAAIKATYRTPGQYAKLTIGEHKPGFFVIANAPGQDTLEFLIKEASPLTAELRTLPAGATLQMTEVMGKGFPIADAAGHDVMLLAAGTGIAALRPLVQYFIEERDKYGAIQLLYGEKTPSRIAFGDEFQTWAAAEIETHTCLSSPGATEGNFEGYVQDCLRSLKPSVTETIGYICGMEPMLVACKQTFAELGGNPDALHTNY